MSSLFSKSAIRQAISSFQGLNIDKEIAIVQELYTDFRNGNMKDETRYEQNFNELFFHQLLGYDPKVNLHPKASTPVGSKIADVGLGFFEDGLYSYEGVKVVVELKGCDTLLDKKQASYGGQSPVDQGFGYKTSFKDCPWLIVSNFASLRLYRDNKQDFEIWTIEDLANPDNEYYNLKTLLGLLKRNHLISQSSTSFSEKLLSEVRTKQEQITKDFYKQYKTLRFELINDIRYHNPEIHVETVVEKAQKIIDRIIFIHFCEDKGLLPEGKLKTNVIRAREADFSPWDVLKKYFKGVDSGSDKLEIPHGYNGGLFHEDLILNNLEIGDAICHKFIDLGNYSFDDELSVNILGHIFEQSISDIEQLKGELLGEEITTDELVEKKESKRKKDGIFYTPEYIVDYIVQNSLMVYLEEKENECLAKYKKENEAYQAYQHILQNIKVLDPACGSGAFLVKVFDYLYAENKRVGQIVKSLFDDDEIYKSILRNNIYGVDLNPESVEITKLSLWLKSAQKGKKLNNLDDNIKCGNSLIDDPAVAGERAFDWQKEFSDIMGAGGFDVIVGNPPYGAKISTIEQNWLTKKYIQGGGETAISFMKLGYDLLKQNGKISYIIPKSFVYSSNYKSIRNLFENELSFLVDCKKVRKEVLLEQIIFGIHKNHITKDYNSLELDKQNFISLGNINKKLINKFGFYINGLSNDEIDIGIKMLSVKYFLNDFGKNQRGAILQKFILPSGKLKVIGGGEIQRTGIIGNKGYLGKEIKIEDQAKINKNSVLVQRIVAHIEKPYNHVKITACIPQFSDVIIVDTINQITLDKDTSKEYIWCLLNSKVVNRYAYRFIFAKAIRTMQFDNPTTSRIPVPKVSLSAQQTFIDKADLMLSLNKELHDKTDSFLRYISSKFGLEKLSTKLSKFYDYDFSTFLKELKFKKLSMSEEAELMEFFDTKKSEIVNLKNKIDATDKEIDEMVFELYGLTDEEKKVVMGE